MNKEIKDKQETMYDILQLALDEGKIKDISIYDYDNTIDISLTVEKTTLLDKLNYMPTQTKTRDELEKIYLNDKNIIKCTIENCEFYTTSENNNCSLLDNLQKGKICQNHIPKTKKGKKKNL